jgi:mannose-6-phosphate isomerase-like protein (cupin superfamily)
MNRCIWTGKSKTSEMPWGYEIEWAGIFRGKEIHLRADHRTSLKFHKGKQEVLYIQHGEVEAEIADESHFQDKGKSPSRRVKLGPGDIINVQAGCAYRLTAIDDSIIFEISSGFSSDPPIRLEDDYGRKLDTSKKYIFSHPKKENDN